jgi:hypothetical protein
LHGYWFDLQEKQINLDTDLHTYSNPSIEIPLIALAYTEVDADFDPVTKISKQPCAGRATECIMETPTG